MKHKYCRLPHHPVHGVYPNLPAVEVCYITSCVPGSLSFNRKTLKCICILRHICRSGNSRGFVQRGLENVKLARQACVPIVSLNDKACNAVRSECVEAAMPTKMHGNTFTPQSTTWSLLEHRGSNHRGPFLSQSASHRGGRCKISSCCFFKINFK